MPFEASQVEVDPKFARAIDPASPPQMRLMAAKGIVPGARPADLLLIQYRLTFDPDESVAAAARTGLAASPTNVVKTSLDAKAPPGMVDFLCRERNGDEELLEFLVLRKQIADETLMFVAETCAILNIVEIIGKNQERLLNNPTILESLKKNPVTPLSLIDVTVAFLQMAGVLPTGAAARAAGLPEKVDSALIDSILGDEEFGEDLTLEAKDGEAQDERTLSQKIADLSVAQKIKLAYKANKEVRQMLIRETNKMIVGAVLNSGRLTDTEVVSLSKSRSVSSDVLRHISKNREWMKNYEVQQGMVSNPKTPQAISIALIKNMRLGDLGALARNTNVPAVVRTTAKQLWEQKQNRR
jgi:hypothetical protein